jgi:hypothetical protein
MYWIITHYWISTMAVVGVVGGIFLVMDIIKLSRRKTYPSPRRNVLLKDLSSKNPRAPLLIRLPKLG